MEANRVLGDGSSRELQDLYALLLTIEAMIRNYISATLFSFHTGLARPPIVYLTGIHISEAFRVSIVRCRGVFHIDLTAFAARILHTTAPRL